MRIGRIYAMLHSTHYRPKQRLEQTRSTRLARKLGAPIAAVVSPEIFACVVANGTVTALPEPNLRCLTANASRLRLCCTTGRRVNARGLLFTL